MKIRRQQKVSLDTSRQISIQKKIKFYQYLLNFHPNLDIGKKILQKETFNAGFPKLPAYFPNNINYTGRQIEQERLSKTEAFFSSPFHTKRIFSVHKKQLSRPQKKMRKSQIQVMAYQSLSPEQKNLEKDCLHVSSMHRKMANSFIATKAVSSIEATCKKATPVRRDSPRKRTYIGKAYFIKNETIFKKQKLNPPPRKSSIAPWEIDQDYILK